MEVIKLDTCIKENAICYSCQQKLCLAPAFVVVGSSSHVFYCEKCGNERGLTQESIVSPHAEAVRSLSEAPF